MIDIKEVEFDCVDWIQLDRGQGPLADCY